MFAFRPRRWIVHTALFFGAGVFAGLYLPMSLLWVAAAVLAALLILLLYKSGRSVYAGVMIFSFFLGLMRCAVTAHPALPPAGEYRICGTVSGVSDVREEDGRVAVYLKNVTLCGETGKTYRLRRVYWTYWLEDDADIAAAVLPLDGQEAAFNGRLYHPSRRTNPHGFDFRLYLLQKGAVAGVSGNDGLALSPEGQSDHKSVLIRIRRAIGNRLALLLGEDASLSTAMLLGDRRDMPEDMAESFREAGVAHVLSVSGLHVMILYALVTRLINRFSPPQWLTLALSCLLMGAYCLLVGLQSAMLRACVLMTYLQSGKIFRRQTDSLTALALAFVTILAIRPLELFAAGFQMSFAAVLGMTMLGDRMRQLTAKIRIDRLRRLIRDYGVTVCACAAVSLPVGWYYHRLSLVGLLINPLLCTLTTVLLPIVPVLLLVSAVHLPAGIFLGRGVAFFSRLITHLVQFAAGAPFASVPVPRFPWYVLLALVIALLLCTRYVLLKTRLRVLLGAGAIAVSILVMILTTPRCVRYIQYDLGSADAAVIEEKGETVVIDAGDYGGDVASYLLSTGRRADHLILTHLHADHVLGVRELIDQHVPIGCIYLSTEAFATPVADECMQVLDMARGMGIPVKTLCAGDELTIGRVRMEVLWPERGGAFAKADGNAFALAMLIDLDGTKMLHMSDVDGVYEMYAAAGADVLKVAHHGSSGSTGAAFLEAVRPGIALLSTSNASAKTLERLAQAGVIVYDTSERGALMLSFDEEGVKIRGYKE